MSVSALVSGVVDALAAIPSKNWTGALSAALRDAQSKTSTEQELADAAKALLPQFALEITAAQMLAQLYVAAGGKPADVQDLVRRRTDGNTMDRDI